jgi:hypothetical protein
MKVPPETLIFIHPIRHLAKRFTSKRNEDFSPLFLPFNQSGPLEQLQVFGHSVQSGVERLRDIEESGWPIRQLPNNRSPRRVRNCGQDIAQMIHSYITPYGVILCKSLFGLAKDFLCD